AQQRPPGDVACAPDPVLPVGPATVRIVFSEPVTPIGGGVQVIGPSGRRVERGVSRVEGGTLVVDVDASAPGTYLVTWRVVADDTHPARGSFAFSVRAPSPLPAAADATAGDLAAISPLGLALQVLARWLHFLGEALGFGTLAFRWLVARPRDVLAEPAADLRLRRLIGLGVALLLVAEPLALFAQAAALGGQDWLDQQVLADALGSSFGRALGLRLGAALLLWLLLGALPPPGALAPGEARVTAVLLGLGAGLAASDGLTAHAASGRLTALGPAANALHVAAMAGWLGCVVALTRVWPLATSRAALLHRAARLAVACVAALVTSGGLMALQHLGAPSDLVATPYGGALSIKLGLLALALSLGLRATRVVPERRPRWWLAELPLLSAIVACAALLVSLV